jgi:hypothetical protein
MHEIEEDALQRAYSQPVGCYDDVVQQQLSARF